MQYTRHENDKSYRRIRMGDSVVPNYEDFKEPKQQVSVQDGEVLEILKCDGSTQIVKSSSHRTVVTYRRTMPPAENGFAIPTNVPTARLWVCSTQGDKMKYKVPIMLPIDTTTRDYKILIVPDVFNAELCGDKYFESLYELQKL